MVFITTLSSAIQIDPDMSLEVIDMICVHKFLLPPKYTLRTYVQIIQGYYLRELLKLILSRVSEIYRKSTLPL